MELHAEDDLSSSRKFVKSGKAFRSFSSKLSFNENLRTCGPGVPNQLNHICSEMCNARNRDNLRYDQIYDICWYVICFFHVATRSPNLGPSPGHQFGPKAPKSEVKPKAAKESRSQSVGAGWWLHWLTKIEGSVHHDFTTVGKQGLSDDDNFYWGC